jgi:hypothetical protein
MGGTPDVAQANVFDSRQLDICKGLDRSSFDVDEPYDLDSVGGKLFSERE